MLRSTDLAATCVIEVAGSIPSREATNQPFHNMHVLLYGWLRGMGLRVSRISNGVLCKKAQLKACQWRF